MHMMRYASPQQASDVRYKKGSTHQQYGRQKLLHLLMQLHVCACEDRADTPVPRHVCVNARLCKQKLIQRSRNQLGSRSGPATARNTCYVAQICLIVAHYVCCRGGIVP